MTVATASVAPPPVRREATPPQNLVPTGPHRVVSPGGPIRLQQSPHMQMGMPHQVYEIRHNSFNSLIGI